MLKLVLNDNLSVSDKLLISLMLRLEKMKKGAFSSEYLSQAASFPPGAYCVLEHFGWDTPDTMSIPFIIFNTENDENSPITLVL